MKTVSIRELRAQSARLWKELPKEKDIVITSNGKPVGILSVTTAETLEKSLADVRRARAQRALTEMQLESVRTGRHKMQLDQINRLVSDVRRSRRA